MVKNCWAIICVIYTYIRWLSKEYFIEILLDYNAYFGVEKPIFVSLKLKKGGYKNGRG